MTKSNKKASNIRAAVDAYVAAAGTGTFNYRQVSGAIGRHTPKEMRTVALYLAELAFDGIIIETAPGKYKSPTRAVVAEGVFVRRSNGRNSVILEPEGDEVAVPDSASMHALNGDRVEVSIVARIKGQDAEAEVTKIIEKKEQTFIGTLKVEKHYAYLQTDSRYLAADIYIPKAKLKGGVTGDKAIVRITDWPEDAKNPTGEIVDILGRTGDNTAEMHAILAEFGLPYRYPEAVEKAADKIDAGITDEVVAAREDLRGVTTFTIDPRDAKDFDDALSYRKLPNGNVEVGVHIADVTHYVKPGSIIDREAEDRATSVYLVDRTIPMLPEHLSNGICSLRPNEEKLTFSAIFELDAKANVVNHRIGRTVIRSDRRFTYEEAQKIIETGEGEYAAELHTLNELAKTLRRRRYDDGALEFDRAEVRFEIDDKGHPISVYFKESKDANKLIEEFMLLANKYVAMAVGKVPEGKKAKTFVYRVHANPDPEKISNFSRIAQRFGFKVQTDGRAKDVNKSLNRMLRNVKGRGEENMLSILAIRSMAKAEYTTDNIGHYGLAFDYYTHFTSPIRRYPDMMVHRLLAKYMEGGRSVDKRKTEDLCEHSSEMEVLATNAERASIRYKQIEFMKDRLGEIYEGVISGVTEWGFYVELDENMCEGLVPVRDLADDYYDFDDKNYCLIGRKHHNKYTLGDRVKVQVARADMDKKMLDFALISDSGNPNKPLPAVPSKKKGKKRKNSRR